MWLKVRGLVSSPLGRVLRNSAVYTVGSMLPQAVSVFLLPIFTRYLSPSDYGILGYSLTAATFFSSLGSLAIQSFVIRHYYDAKAAGDTRRFFGTVFLFLVMFNVVLLAAASLVLPSIFAWGRVQVPFTPYVQLAFISAVLQVAGLVPMSYLRATERAPAYVAVSLLSALVTGGMSLYFVIGRGQGVLGRFYGQLTGDAVMLVIYLVIMSRIARFAWRPAYVRQALTFCLPLMAAQFVAMFSSMSDRLILERYVPLSALGLYSVAAGIAATAPIITSGLYSAIQPQIFRLASAGELDRRITTIKRYVVWLFMGLICAQIALSRDLVALLAGPAFRDSYRIATPLIIGILLQSFITNMPSQYLTAVGKTRFELPNRLIGGAIGLAAMLFLVPTFGVYGAAAASIITALATLAAYGRVLRRHSAVAWRLTQDALSIGTAALAGYILLQLQVGNLLVDAALKVLLIAVSAVVYLIRSSASIRVGLANLGVSWQAERP